MEEEVLDPLCNIATESRAIQLLITRKFLQFFHQANLYVLKIDQ